MSVSAKDLIVKPITAQAARAVVQRWHYSGKSTANSQLHFGVFLGETLHGAMQFGPPLDRRKLLPLVAGTKWNDMIELNRMAFGPALPRNSESRALAVAFKIMRKAYPNIEWVVSFADGAQCGDGTIYRASGFVLTAIKRNDQIWAAPTGDTFSRTSLTDGRSKQQQQQQARVFLSRSSMTMKGSNGGGAIRAAIGREHGFAETGAASMKQYEEAGFKPLPGFQLRYVYFLNPSARERLTVPVLPFSAIDAAGARMYRGEARPSQRTSGDQSESGGAAPTRTLHPSDDT